MTTPASPGQHLRGAIVVTGTEVLGGRVADRNGPWVSQRFADCGVETAAIFQVGDRREDLLAALRQATELGVELIVTTGGLGPTADDLTMELVAQFTGRPLQLDTELEQRVWQRVENVRVRFPDIDMDSLRQTTRKQAMQPSGAVPLEPVGTAPGSIVAPAGGAGPLVVVLPGPPSELQPMWRAAETTEPLAGLLAQTSPFQETTLRLIGLPESDLAATLRAAEDDGLQLGKLEVTTCMRKGEIEIVTRYDAADAGIYADLDRVIRERYGDRLYSDDGATVDQVVSRTLLERGWTLGLAESCTGGMIAALMVEPAGASDFLQGGVVAYDNTVKAGVLGVPQAVLEGPGAVSEECALAMAEGARRVLGADCGLSVTGIAGPAGGTAEKPVGTVWVGAAVPGRDPVARHMVIPGNRDAVRERSVTFALHHLRLTLQAG